MKEITYHFLRPVPIKKDCHQSVRKKRIIRFLAHDDVFL